MFPSTVGCWVPGVGVSLSSLVVFRSARLVAVSNFKSAKMFANLVAKMTAKILLKCLLI